MKKRLIYMFAVGITILIFSICCSDDTIVEPGAGFVEGYVYESGTTNPIDSVKIFLDSADDSVFTDITGYYIISDWPFEHTLHAQKNGYIDTSVEIDMIPEDTIIVNFELQKE